MIPQTLVDRERAHHGITKLHIVQSMHERKSMMADLADGFLALPGGFGTWEEFLEVLTWSQLGLQNKACVILNVLGSYDALLSLTDRAVEEGFLLPIHRRMLLAGDDPERLVDELESFVVPVVEKWLDSTTR